MDLVTHGLTAALNYNGIQRLAGFGRLVGPLAQSVLYPHCIYATLYLNIFRREPAISQFDWPFTPTHSSSPIFSTIVSSDLHWVLPQLHPGHR